ncbi:hypothetical protein HNQ88_002157 [Aureibacter tunicatorum]|uniref:Uncharacterized protein n=1 Tax=Aureibacter tunicatorum TaxID=866807 RepID=A0AAE3XMB3_9BACT|nr:hypothetical protein [Aureibacter tunicatorum]BDD04954.1 hypothetical protein AUTU_24370 [Aureibacter tunicatorum]
MISSIWKPEKKEFRKAPLNIFLLISYFKIKIDDRYRLINT